MSDTNQNNDKANKGFEEEAFGAIETRRIKAIIDNQVRSVECGTIVQICKTALLEPESYKRMREVWIYGIVSNKETFFLSHDQLHIKWIGHMNICQLVKVV